MTFNEREYKERKEIIKYISNWLKKYSHDVIVKVLEKREELVNDEFTMKLLKELYEREEEEEKEFYDRIFLMVENYETQKQFNPHNNCLTHSNSYRDVLYDMYIKD